jgi:hypothetical protein
LTTALQPHAPSGDGAGGEATPLWRDRSLRTRPIFIMAARKSQWKRGPVRGKAAGRGHSIRLCDAWHYRRGRIITFPDEEHSKISFPSRVRVPLQFVPRSMTASRVGMPRGVRPEEEGSSQRGVASRPPLPAAGGGIVNTGAMPRFRRQPAGCKRDLCRHGKGRPDRVAPSRIWRNH